MSHISAYVHDAASHRPAHATGVDDLPKSGAKIVWISLFVQSNYTRPLGKPASRSMRAQPMPSINKLSVACVKKTLLRS